MAPKLVHLLLRAAYADWPDRPIGVVFLASSRHVPASIRRPMKREGGDSGSTRMATVAARHLDLIAVAWDKATTFVVVGRENKMCDWTFDSPAKRPSAGNQSLASRFC